MAKYKEQDESGVRKELIKLMMEQVSNKDTADKMIFDPTDVTGSLGCWGISQLNSRGRFGK